MESDKLISIFHFVLHFHKQAKKREFRWCDVLNKESVE